MTSSQEWDITTISPSQWTKLVAETAHDKGNKHLYWNGGRSIKHLQESPAQSDYHLMSVSELWNCSQKIFTQNIAYRQESRTSGRDLLRNFKMLLSVEDDRIKSLSSAVFPQAQPKEIESVKMEVNLLEANLDPSKRSSEFFMKAVADNDVAAIKKWILFGADLNKPLDSGLLPLLYVMKFKPETNLELVELLLHDSDVFNNKDAHNLSAFDNFLNYYISTETTQGTILLSMFLDKFLAASSEEKPNIMENINQALKKIFCSFGRGTLLDEKFISKYLTLVESLSKAGASINIILNVGKSLLALAIEDGNRDLAEKLIKMGADLRPALKQLGFNRLNSKLMYSAWKGDVDAVKRILTPRTKYLLGNAKDKEGNTALIWAVRMGHVDVVKQLVKEGVDLNAKNKKGHRALGYADKREDIHAILSEAGARNDLGQTYLMIAAEDNKLDDLKLDSIDRGLLNARSDLGLTVLHIAVWSGNAHLVEQLIKAGANLNLVSKGLATPLIMALDLREMGLSRQLIKAGADLNIRTLNGKRAYDLAQGELKIILENAGAKDINGQNKLMRAVLNNDEKMVDELIAQGFNLDDQSDDGKTALFYVAASHNYSTGEKLYSIGEKLLQAGANVNIGDFTKPLEIVINSVNAKSITPKTIQFAETLIKYGAKLQYTSELQYAIWKGDTETVTKMISSMNIDLNAQDKKGCTAINFAIRMQQLAALKLLIDAHADVDLGNPLRHAISDGLSDYVDLLLQAKANVNIKYMDEFANTTPLHMAIRQGDIRLVDKLLKAGADTSARDYLNDTPLIACICIHKRQKIFLERLLAEKIDVNEKDTEGRTALFLAVKNGEADFVELLIRANADPNIKDKNGRTPLIEAIATIESDRIIKLLLGIKNINANLKDRDGNTALLWAAHLQNLELVDQLIKCGVDLDVVNNSELTTVSYLYNQIELLQIDIAAAHPDMVKKSATKFVYEHLIGKLTDAGARNHLGQTPLMRAVFNIDEKAAFSKAQEWISRKKEAINATDSLGMSAAMYAAKAGYLNLLKLLMQADADLLIQDNLGRTALYHAMNLGKKDVVAHLLGSPLYEKLQILFPNMQDIFKEGSAEKIVKELLPKLSPSERAESLLLPYLLHFRGMAKFMTLALTKEERQLGLDFLAKKHPKADMNWFKESLLDFHSSHFKVVEEVIPPAPKGVNLDLLLHMFDQINTIDPRQPGYLDPQRLKDDGAPRTLEQIRASLQLMVTRVKNKNEAFLATPPADTPELVEFYTKLENALAHIILKLSEPSIKPDNKTSALFDLAIAGGHCGARYKTETAHWYKFLTRGIEALTLQQEIENILQNTRIGVVEKMTKDLTYPDGKRIPIGNRPHSYNQIVRTIGKDVGIPGVSETYEDKYFWLAYLTKEILRAQFIKDYFPTTMIDRIDAAINGVVDESGKRVPASREFNPDGVDLWFKDNIAMPPDWKLKEPLSFTTVYVYEEEHTFDYQAFSETVNKEFEVERKRLESLSDAVIVKEGNAKIKEFLSGKYFIKLGDEVDPQNWEQVQRAIQMQLKGLKGGSRLQQPDTLKSIKDYIEKLTGRQKYINFALGSLLDKFGILASSKSQEEVKQVLENMRRKEYVETEIRKSGLVSRDGILSMLLAMKILIM